MMQETGFDSSSSVQCTLDEVPQHILDEIHAQEPLHGAKEDRYVSLRAAPPVGPRICTLRAIPRVSSLVPKNYAI